MTILSPTSGWLLALLAGLALAIVVLTVVYWDAARLRRTRRIGGLVISQLAFFAAFLVLLNREIQFFASWSELFGRGAR